MVLVQDVQVLQSLWNVLALSPTTFVNLVTEDSCAPQIAKLQKVADASSETQQQLQHAFVVAIDFARFAFFSGMHTSSVPGLYHAYHQSLKRLIRADAFVSLALWGTPPSNISFNTIG
eukprot:2161763-Amphidinium_carterae.1